jgi:hypothetical protein
MQAIVPQTFAPIPSSLLLPVPNALLRKVRPRRAEEFIDWCKFGVRIHALVGSVNPFPIYIFRDSLDRFCSDE